MFAEGSMLAKGESPFQVSNHAIVIPTLPIAIMQLSSPPCLSQSCNCHPHPVYRNHAIVIPTLPIAIM